jgi:hypothetical protein
MNLEHEAMMRETLREQRREKLLDAQYERKMKRHKSFRQEE